VSRMFTISRNTLICGSNAERQRFTQCHSPLSTWSQSKLKIWSNFCVCPAHGHLTQQAMAQQWEGTSVTARLARPLKRLVHAKKRLMATENGTKSNAQPHSPSVEVATEVVYVDEAGDDTEDYPHGCVRQERFPALKLGIVPVASA